MTLVSARATAIAALAAAIAFGGAAPAAAQRNKKPADPAPPAADAPADEAPAPPPEDPPPDERTMEGVDENPGAPSAETIEQPPAPPPVAAPTRKGYPIEEVLRPITLPAVTSEVGLDLRVVTAPVFSGTLRARYGITRQAQIGLRYGLGAAFDPDGSEGTTFKTGKAVSIDLAYAPLDWVAAQVSVPIYFDPFAIGLVLGAPVKVRFGDVFALFAAQDLVEIKLDGFVPSVIDESQNVANAARLDVNEVTDDGVLRFTGGAIVQVQPNLAVIGFAGVEYFDFASLDPGYPLRVTAQYTLSQDVDVAARVGFDNLDQASDSFGLQLTAQLRI